jgi:adenine-specific DNA-methyltransferase
VLELVWSGKSDSAQRTQVPLLNREMSRWQPQSPMYSSSVDAAHASEQPSHRVIAGDNLEVLRWFKNSDEKFDVIYIDPPYNTGSPLTYNDKRIAGRESRSSASAAWLSEIYPRLLLARELLAESGVMFVSIDDNEACHLLTLMREVFGQSNHLGTIKWRRKRKPSFLDSHMSSVLEYVLVFARNAALCPRLLGRLTEESTRPVLNASNKIVERIIPEGFPAHCSDGQYPAGEFKNRSLSFELLDPLVISQGVVQLPARVRGPFRIHQQLWEKTGFITKNFGLRRRVLADEQKRRHAEDDGTDWPTNEDAQDELISVFGERVFDFPKPVGLLVQLLSMVPCTKNNMPQRCLDFYAGSGSFLIAALEQSRLDGIARSVDLVQSREKVRSARAHQFSDIAEICAHRVLADSRRRGFSPFFHFIQVEHKE